MRITRQQAAAIVAGYLIIADLLGHTAPVFYSAGNRSGIFGRAADLSLRPDVLSLTVWRVNTTVAERLAVIDGPVLS